MQIHRNPCTGMWAIYMDDATKFTYKTGFGWKNLNLLKNSYKVIMMTVINDTSLRLMLAIQIPSDLPFFPVTMNIGKKKTKKTNKLWKKEKKKNYVVIIKISKQALDYGLILEKVYKVTQFSQEAWLRPYIDMNVELSKKVKNDFEFGKSVERLWQRLGKLWWIWGITWASNLWRLTKEEIVQLVPDVPWASCNGLMMVLTPVTCRGPSGD